MFLNEINAGSNLGTKNSIANNYEKGFSSLFGSLKMRPSSNERLREYDIFKSFLDEMVNQCKITGFVFADNNLSNCRIHCSFCGWEDESEIDPKIGLLSEEDIHSRHIRIYDGKTGVSMHWYPFDPSHNTVLEIATYETDESREASNELDYRESTNGVKFMSSMESFLDNTGMTTDTFCTLTDARFKEWINNVDSILTVKEQGIWPRALRYFKHIHEIVKEQTMHIMYDIRIIYLRMSRLKIRDIIFSKGSN